MSVHSGRSLFCTFSVGFSKICKTLLYAGKPSKYVPNVMGPLINDHKSSEKRVIIMVSSEVTYFLQSREVFRVKETRSLRSRGLGQ